MKFLKFIILFLSLTVYSLLFTSPVYAKDYSITSVNFNVQLNSDGSADVVEQRTYTFNGSYHWIDERINLGCKVQNDVGAQRDAPVCENFRISNFELWEGNPASQQGGQKYVQSANETAGNYQLSVTPQKLYFKAWYEANYESKTFTLKYKIDNATVNQNDIAEFYWQLIGSEWQIANNNISAKVILPSPAPSNQIWGFGHGPLNGKIAIPTASEVNFSSSSVSPGTFFEIRVLFPKLENAVFAQNGTKTLQGILAEEKGFADKTIADKKMAAILTILAVLFPLVLLFLFTVLCVRYVKLWKKEIQGLSLPEVNLAGKLHEPPSDLPPASVEALLKSGKKFSSDTFLSMILYLVLKRVVKIKSEKKKTLFGGTAYEYSLVKGEKFGKAKLKDFEEDLIQFIFEKAGKGKDEVKFDEIKDYAKDHQSTSYHFFNDFKSKAFNSLTDYGLLESTPAELKRKKRTFILRSVLVIVLTYILVPIFSVASAAVTSSAGPIGGIFIMGWSWVLIPVSIVLFAKYSFDKRRTEKGRTGRYPLN